MSVYLDLARGQAPLVLLGALLFGAALSLMTPNARASWMMALVAGAITAGVAIDMGWRHLNLTAETPPLLLLALDGVGAFAAPLLVCLMGLVVLADGAVLRGRVARTQPYVIALHLVGVAGWVGALLARDLIGVVVGANIGWLALTALTAAGAERGALHGALRMVTAGGAGAAFMVAGAALLTYATGNLAVDAAASAIIAAPQMGALGFVLLLAPLMLMAGAAPLHHWSGAAYGRSDATLALTLGALGALALIARLAAVAATAPAVAESVSLVLVVIGVASVLIGSLQAIGANNVRRMVGYAGAAQVGCILIAIALESPAGLAAALVQMFAWGAGAFALLAGVAASKDAALVALDGLGRRAPIAGVAITVGALSFMGAPLTIGFLGRWRLIEASVGAGWWWATGAAIVTSLAAVFYGGRLIERIYFRRASEAAAFDLDVWRWARAPVLIAAIAAIACGLAPAWLLDLAARASALALGLGA